MVTVLRRLLLWTVVCSVSAAPPFFFARSERFDPRAMVAVVALFVLAYTAVTSLPWFARFHARPFVRRTLYFGYGARIVLSLAVPLVPFAFFPDLFVGMVSVAFSQDLLRLPERSFAATFVATCAHGTLMNAVVGVLMLVTYALHRAVGKAPVNPRAFEVVMPPVAQPDPRVPAVPHNG